MTITFSIEWLFFIIPFSIAFIFSLKTSDVRGFAGSERDWYWFVFGPITLIISLVSWIIYLKFFK